MRKVKKLSRRDFLRISTGLALGAVAAACAPAKPTPAPTEVPEVPEAPAAPELPFEVAPEAIDPLNVEKGTAEGIFFEGGYGIDYIKYAADILDELHPETEISVTGIQRVDEQLRPRFIAGNPPDVIDNSGAGNLDTTALAAEGQLLDLEPLMNAAALDTPSKLFKETLFPGSQDVGVFDGKQLFLNIAYTVFGVWHSKSLFEKKGWEYPKMWDDMLDFCAMIKKETDMSPWTYQGKYPGYMVFGVLVPLIYKIGGNQAIIKELAQRRRGSLCICDMGDVVKLAVDVDVSCLPSLWLVAVFMLFSQAIPVWNFHNIGQDFRQARRVIVQASAFHFG